jgi:hypothetical protein
MIAPVHCRAAFWPFTPRWPLIYDGEAEVGDSAVTGLPISAPVCPLGVDPGGPETSAEEAPEALAAL